MAYLLPLRQIVLRTYHPTSSTWNLISLFPLLHHPSIHSSPHETWLSVPLPESSLFRVPAQLPCLPQNQSQHPPPLSVALSPWLLGLVLWVFLHLLGSSFSVPPTGPAPLPASYVVMVLGLCPSAQPPGDLTPQSPSSCAWCHCRAWNLRRDSQLLFIPH